VPFGFEELEELLADFSAFHRGPSRFGARSKSCDSNLKVGFATGQSPGRNALSAVGLVVRSAKPIT
jgi:hypothetical protein